jgi:hypothetical protein
VAYTLSLLALATDLGRGESEAIAIAHERRALLIVDDALARRHATLLGARRRRVNTAGQLAWLTARTPPSEPGDFAAMSSVPKGTPTVMNIGEVPEIAGVRVEVDLAT